jgi:hypothetical protein
MNERSDIDRVLRRWMEDGPSVMPDRVIDVIADQISLQSQRRSWHVLRRLPMSPYVKLGAAIAAVLVIAVVGWNLLPGRSGVGGPGGSPPPTVPLTPHPSAIALIAPTGSLAPGTYSVPAGAGHLSFTVPTGWAVPQVGSGSSDFTLHLNAGPSDDTLKVFFDMRRAAKDTACTEAPEPGVGATAQALVANFRADGDLNVTPPTPIRIGDLQGLVIDVTLAAGTTRTCPFSSGAPSVPLVVDTLTGAGPFWGIGPNEKIRLVILDAPGVTNVVIVVDSAAGGSFDQLVNATMPVLQTLVLSPT